MYSYKGNGKIMYFYPLPPPPQKKKICRSSLLTSSPIAGLSMENVNGIMGEPTPSTSEYGSGMKVRTLLC